MVTHFERFLRYIEADHVFSTQNIQKELFLPRKLLIGLETLWMPATSSDSSLLPVNVPHTTKNDFKQSICFQIWKALPSTWTAPPLAWEACDVPGPYPEKWWQRTCGQARSGYPLLPDCWFWSCCRHGCGGGSCFFGCRDCNKYPR